MRQHHARDPAGQAQQRALDQQLTDEPAPARSQRHAHRDLAIPSRRPHQQQIGEVGARHQQHEANHDRQQPRDRVERRIDHRVQPYFVDGQHHHSASPIRLRVS